jgi:ribosomal protein S18 acetylase RimI-like enzyme
MTNSQIRFLMKKHNIDRQTAIAMGSAFDPSDIEIVIAESSDGANITTWHRKAVNAFVDEKGGAHTGQTSRSNWEYTSGHHEAGLRFAFAKLRSQIVGYIEIYPAKMMAGRGYFNGMVIEWVYVDRRFRNCGVATKLYKFAMDEFGANAIDLTFSTINQNHSYFRLLGFEWFDADLGGPEIICSVDLSESLFLLRTTRTSKTNRQFELTQENLDKFSTVCGRFSYSVYEPLKPLITLNVATTSPVLKAA